MKTATIQNSLIRGSNNGVFFTVQYRGKVLFYLSGERADSAQIFQQCKQWAIAQGFTHIKQVTA